MKKILRFLQIITLLCIVNFIISISLITSKTKTTKQNKEDKGNIVVIHELGDPDKIQPSNSTSANSTYIEGNIFMTLLGNESTPPFKSYGYLAESTPKTTELYDGTVKYEYRLRDEATWDNGTPVTGADVLFSYKVYQTEYVDCEHLRGYMDFIIDVQLDQKDPKKVNFITKKYFLGEAWTGYWVLPRYNYDRNNILEKFSFKEIKNKTYKSNTQKDNMLREFAEEYNSEKFQREKEYISGCGPYEFVEWVTGQRIKLKKKENWWGDKLASKDNNHFDANPEEIIYEIINDYTTAITAMKDGSIDVMRSVPAKNFVNLKENKKFLEKYSLHTPVAMSYLYIGMNMDHPILSDLNVRKAFSHMVDRQKIIDQLYKGYAQEVSGPIHPTKAYYNREIKPYEYDIKKAEQLLNESGWTDSDGDGIRDKIVDGEKVDMKFTFKYNTGNDIRQNIGLMFQQDAKRLGIEIEILGREWTVYLDEVKSHKFEFNCLGWVQGTGLDDFRQIWHTESINGGSNYVSFGDNTSDKIIEEIQQELNEEARNKLYKEFQNIIHGQAPYIFLCSSQERISINNRFEAQSYIARPGYNEKEFTLKNNLAATAQ